MKLNIKKPNLKNIKLKNINVIQFVPLIFVISLVANSVVGYTAPKSNPVSKVPATEVSADNKKETKKAKKASMGELDLSKIKDGTYEGSGTGFRGTVKVSVTVKDHKITDIKILSSQDDATFFNRAKSGVIASIIKEQSLNVDVVSGATYSSKGILAAVKNALTGEKDNSKAAGANASAAGGAGTAGKLAAADESGTYKDGTYEGTGTGFRGTIKVSVTIKDSKIKSIKVLSKQDDPAYFNRAKSGVLAAIVKKQTTNVDTVSGATYSSNGLISAVRNALKKAAVNKTAEDKDDNANKKEDKDTNTNTNTGATLTGDYKEGTFKGTGMGFRGETTVSVKIKSDRMTSIKILKKHDDEPFFTNAKAVIKLMIAGQKYDVDTVSGATYSSKGIIAAVKDALGKAEITNKKPSSDDTDKDDDKKDDNNDNDKKDDDNKEPATDDPSTEEPKEDLVSGTFSGSATCYPDDDNDFNAYTLSLNVVVKDGKVTEIKDIKGAGNGYIAINDSFIRSAKNGVLPQLLKGNTSCDMVSGATCSSKAIVAAYKDAMAKVK